MRRDQILTDIFRLRRWWTLRVAPSFHTLGSRCIKMGRSRAFWPSECRRPMRCSATTSERRSRTSAPSCSITSAVKCAGATIFRCRIPHLRRGGDCGRGDAHLTALRPSVRIRGYPLSAGREVLSLTIPIQVPTGGASPEYWPVDLPEFEMLSRAGEVTSVADATRRHEMRRVWYATGRPCDSGASPAPDRAQRPRESRRLSDQSPVSRRARRRRMDRLLVGVIWSSCPTC